MAEAAFNTIAEIQRLRDAGFPQAQAEAITLSIHSGVTGGVATKDDVERAEERLNAEIKLVRKDVTALNDKIDRVEVGLNTKIDLVKESLEKQIDKQGVALGVQIANLKTDIAEGQASNLRWMIGLFAGFFIGMGGLMLAAVRLMAQSL